MLGEPCLGWSSQFCFSLTLSLRPSLSDPLGPFGVRFTVGCSVIATFEQLWQYPPSLIFGWCSCWRGL